MICETPPLRIGISDESFTTKLNQKMALIDRCSKLDVKATRVQLNTTFDVWKQSLINLLILCCPMILSSKAWLNTVTVELWHKV